LANQLGNCESMFQPVLSTGRRLQSRSSAATRPEAAGGRLCTCPRIPRTEWRAGVSDRKDL